MGKKEMPMDKKSMVRYDQKINNQLIRRIILLILVISISLIMTFWKDWIVGLETLGVSLTIFTIIEKE